MPFDVGVTSGTALKRKPKVRAKKSRLKQQVAAKVRELETIDQLKPVRSKASTGDILKGARPLPRDDQGPLRFKTPAAQRKAQTEQRKVPAKVKLAEFVGKDAAQVLSNAGKDIVHLPQTVVQGTYELGAAAVEAAGGDTKRAKKLGKGFIEHDPFYLAGDAAVKKLSGDDKGAKEAWRKSKRELKEHPGLAALEAVGVKGSIGKGATRIAEKRGLNPTARVPAKFPNSALEIPRVHSRDAFQRAFDKRQDAAKVRKADAMRAEAHVLEQANPAANASRIDELRVSANHKDPRIASEKQAKVRAARSAAAGRAVSEANQAAVSGQVRAAITPPKAGGRLKRRTAAEKPSAAHALAAQAITDGTPASLRAYKSHLAQQYPTLSHAEQRVNRELQGQIDKAIAAKHTPADVAAGAKGYRDAVQPLQRQLIDEGILPGAKAEKAPLVPYAVTQMPGVKPGPKGPVRAVDGKPVKVKAAEIRAHMAARGVPEPAYVSQRASVGAAAGGPLRHPQVTGPARTGKSTVVGAFDASPEVLARTASNAQRLVDMSRNYESHLREFAHAPSRGKLTRTEAQKLAGELHARDGVQYVAVPDKPFAGDRTLAGTLDDADSPASLKAVSESLARAYAGEGGKSGTYSIIPKAAADELVAQARATVPTGPVATTLKGVSSVFRRTVLATSPSWFTGNAVEGALRSAVAGVRPGDKALFDRTVAKLEQTDPRIAQELRARVAGGGHYHAADRSSHSGLLSQYDHTSVKPIADKLQRFWAKPGPKEAAHLWNAWTHLVFNQLSGRMESGIQSSMAGAALRKGNLIPHDVPKLSQAAVDQAARGLKSTNEQAALGERVAQMYGRYDGFTADTRHHIATYTPFLAWTLNAGNFVLRVLPRDHPTAVALAVVQERAIRQMMTDANMDDVPAWLVGAIPLAGGRHLRAARYTPFGAFGDPAGTIGSAVLPQFSGVLAALRGEDWKGKKLYDKNHKPIGDAEKAKVAAASFLEATVPIYGKIKQVAEKGPSSLNPLKPVEAAPSKLPQMRAPAASTSGEIDFSTFGSPSISGIDFSAYGQ